MSNSATIKPSDMNIPALRKDLACYINIFSVLLLLLFNSCQKGVNVNLTKQVIPLSVQIKYTDIIPDVTKIANSTTQTSSFNIDVNNDGINDFIITVKYMPQARCGAECTQGYSYASVISLDNNFVVNTGASIYFAIPLSLNTSIDANSKTWYSGESNLATKAGRDCCSTNKSWIGQGDKYLGLQLRKSSSIYYGWLRLSVSALFNGGQFIVKDYAFNNSPNTPILAGQVK